MEHSSNIARSVGPTAEEWQLHRPTIKRLYLDEDRTLPDVMRIMQQQHSFKASTKMYRSRLSLWKIDNKNLRKAEIKQIAHTKVTRDAAGKKSVFKVKGRDVSEGSVLRYVKKHGFSKWVDYVRAASPFEYDNQIVCYTPAQSPSLAAALQDLNIYFDQSPILGSGQYDLGMQGILSLSPRPQSWRLVPISPVPRSLSLPTVWERPEQLLWTLRSYLQGSFDSNSWFTDKRGLLKSTKDLGGPQISLQWDCGMALEMFQQGNYVQARQLLSRACVYIEHCVRFDTPHLMNEIFFILAFLQRIKSFGIEAIILPHFSLSSKYLLGDQHPLTQLSQQLVLLDSNSSDLLNRLLKCYIHVMEDRVGEAHIATLHARESFARNAGGSEAVVEARALHAFCEKAPIADSLKQAATVTLARVLHNNKQDQEALEIMLKILEEIVHDLEPHAWDLTSRILGRLGDLAGAEHYNQLSVEQISAQERSVSYKMRFMCRRAVILRHMGRIQEAEEMEEKIDILLGPPQIKELLEEGPEA